MKTKVIFREYADHSIIALFPEINADNSFYNCLSYMHIGQHGAANCSGVIGSTFAATNYNDLKNELEKMGYNLAIRKRYTRSMLANRIKSF